MIRLCPKCWKIYEPELQFCLDDGNLLVSRRVDEKVLANLFGDKNAAVTLPFPATRTLTNPPPPRPKLNSPLGLLALLAVMLLLSVGFIWSGINVVTANRGAETVSHKDKSANLTPEKIAVEIVETNQTKSIGEQQTPAETKTGNSEKPPVKSPSPQNRFNGRVIMLNAILRTAPTMDANKAEILALDAPVKIGKKASANSPWYRVITESGNRGWMHGNTIEFN